MSVTSVRLKSELEGSLETLAEKLQRSKNWLINQAIREFIEKNDQEAKRWQDTLIAINSVNKGTTLSEDKVQDWLESWGEENELKSPKL